MSTVPARRAARALTATLVLLALPLRADAQLGGLMKKAKEKIAATAQPEAEGKNVSNNEKIGDPFDAASLSATIAGLKVYKSRITEAAAIDKQIADNEKATNALRDKNKRAIDEYGVNDDAIRRCIDSDMDARRPAREAAMQARMMQMMTDQKFLAEYQRLGTAMQQALAKQDTVAQKKITAELGKLSGMDDDSLPSFKKCGRPPAKPAAMIEIERMEKEREALVTKSRQTSSVADIDAARAASTTPAKFQQQRERLVTFQSDKKPFSPTEQSLIASRKSEIDPLIK